MRRRSPRPPSLRAVHRAAAQSRALGRITHIEPIPPISTRKGVDPEAWAQEKDRAGIPTVCPPALKELLP